MTYSKKYSVYGIVFGLCFPVVATLIDAFLTTGSISMDAFIFVQLQNPLLWMIDSAPLFLGFFAYLGGVQCDKFLCAENEKQELNRMLIEKNKELEDKVRARTYKLEDNIKKMAKLECIRTDFIATVSHELRTPLTAIGGAIKLIKSKAVGSIDEKGMGLIKLADRNVNLLTCLVNDILDIEKIESGKLEFDLDRHSIYQLINKSIEMSQPYAESFSVGLVIEDFDPDIFVMIDSRRLVQIMMNLLSNACKFSPINSIVTITLCQFGSNIRVSVADLGTGIPESLKSQIFSKFTQADSSSMRTRNGTGLGLNISKSLTEAMGGKIGFYPNTSRGTVFYIEFEEFSHTMKLSSTN